MLFFRAVFSLPTSDKLFNMFLVLPILALKVNEKKSLLLILITPEHLLCQISNARDNLEEYISEPAFQPAHVIV